MSDATVEISCSRCGRRRRVRADSMPAKMKGAKTWSGKRWITHWNATITDAGRAVLAEVSL